MEEKFCSAGDSSKKRVDQTNPQLLENNLKEDRGGNARLVLQFLRMSRGVESEGESCKKRDIEKNGLINREIECSSKNSLSAEDKMGGIYGTKCQEKHLKRHLQATNNAIGLIILTCLFLTPLDWI